MTHYADLLKYICTSFFKWDGEKDEKGRTLLQTIGTDIVRVQNPNYWVNFISDMLDFFGSLWDYMIIPDVRFPNEISVLRDRGYAVVHIKISREGISSLSNEQKSHSSEVAMDKVEGDYHIINDGNLDELKKKMKDVTESIVGLSHGKKKGGQCMQIDPFCTNMKIVGDIGDILFQNELKNRRINLNSEIDMDYIEEAVRLILTYNRMDKDIPRENRIPIILYISSNGGSVDAGFELIDVILNSKTPIYTVNLGYQYSMGFLIGLAGHKRFASENAKFLMHDGSSVTYGSSSKVRDEVEFREREQVRIRDYVLAHSKITPEEYDSKLRVEWYLFANEAKEKGFVDYIIGTDCDFDEIL